MHWYQCIGSPLNLLADVSLYLSLPVPTWINLQLAFHLHSAALLELHLALGAKSAKQTHASQMSDESPRSQLNLPYLPNKFDLKTEVFRKEGTHSPKNQTAKDCKSMRSKGLWIPMSCHVVPFSPSLLLNARLSSSWAWLCFCYCGWLLKQAAAREVP